MTALSDYQLNKYLGQLDDIDQDNRIRAIDFLGDSGDELCLKELRERLKYINREHQALIIAVGKLKKNLVVK
jgi:hypothetical protein